ncbi:hypothetical protein [Nocardiopsis salina]|uniref:hypothetical protein n=1 Tax=Nocardiopsis salina TaxID=245836 RepID=UPI000346A1B5|nr:hypothetical protein [Nocardiopsis salina]
MKPPMPTQLTVVRVILFVYVVLATLGLLSFFWLVSESGAAFEEAVALTGMPMGLFLVGMLFASGVLILAFVAALRMGSGGSRTQTLLRTALAMAILGALINVVQGSGHLGFVLVLVALVLAETRAAKEWFASTETENDQDAAPTS